MNNISEIESMRFISNIPRIDADWFCYQPEVLAYIQKTVDESKFLTKEEHQAWKVYKKGMESLIRSREDGSFYADQTVKDLLSVREGYPMLGITIQSILHNKLGT